VFKNLYVKWIFVAAFALCGALIVTGCGGGGSNTSAVKEAEQHGEEKKEEEDKENRLEGEIEELKQEREREKQQALRQLRRQRHHEAHHSAPSPSPAPAPEPAPQTSESERSSCGGSLSVGPDTSCGFAENVRSEYEFEIGEGSGTVYAYSEANNETYEMFCTSAPHECTGAISAKVYFP
jgi:hypothetical protein